MATLVQKMKIFDKYLKEIFQNSPLSNQLLHLSKMAAFALRNT